MLSTTVCFTDLDQGSEILSKFSYAKSMKHNQYNITDFVKVVLQK